MPSAQGAIDYALSKVGDPYVWGATGPNSFDCSGLMVAAFGSIGVSLPRTSYAQALIGTSVDPANVAPGDLVFPSADLGHVTMALGGGKQVEAPYTGANVRVSAMYGIARVRRVADPGVGPSGQASSAETVGLTNPLSTAEKAWNAIQEIGKLIHFLTDPHNWIRIGAVLGGIVLVAVAIARLAGVRLPLLGALT